MVVYILYKNFGGYEGCDAPEKATLDKDIADKWVEDIDKHDHVSTVAEIELSEQR